ncbi:MAG: TusE/DsrC/DsvC family sulfur relay protein [Myxococcales bacterium]|nr:TusE/DsrC/DsvC family sulfur relay protein [Myxococcales bacterium]
MPTRQFGSYDIEVDRDGHLADASQWTPELAQAIAHAVGVGRLSARHWDVINFCREQTRASGAVPGLRHIARGSGVSLQELYDLFPRVPGKLAALLAGLSKPKSCI